MANLLLITSSIFGENSKSGRLAREFVAGWTRKHPGAKVVERDLGAEPVPHLSGPQFATLMTPADSRNAEQQRAAAASDVLIEELEAADTIVIASPMHNFAISSTLKAWIDHVARAGRTFRYTAQGPEGLLRNKKVFVVTGRGGIYTEGPMMAYDFQEPYLRKVLGFLGLTDVTFIHIEGLAISPDQAEKGLARARSVIQELVPAVQVA